MKKQKIKKTLKHLTISRKKWGRRSLLTSTNKMCCLGFACAAVGYDLKEENKKLHARLGMPDEIDDFKGPKWLAKSKDAGSAAYANDILNGKEREQAIRRIFAEHGCKVRFVK